MKKIKNKNISIFKMPKAFTLAEIIIVIGIIGMIATMTLPTLIENTQESIWKNAAREAFSKASQAVEQMRMDNGGTMSNYYEIYTFHPSFVKYFKVIPGKAGDFSTTTHTEDSVFDLPGYKTLAGGNPDGHLMDDGQFITADGMLWMIENAGGPIYITVDINGIKRKPNVFGKDTFMFQVLNDNLLPMGAKNSDWPASTYCTKTNSNQEQGFGCMYYVMQGIDY